MTSGVFEYLPIASIIVNRDERQRRELVGIEELAESIRTNGLIHPIVVTRERVLVAGERRLTAHKELGYDQIAAQYTDQLDPTVLQILELEENIRRVDLTWQDTVRSVARFDELKRETSEDWSADDTAEALNMSRTNINRYKLVNDFLEREVPEVMEAPRLSTAVGFCERAVERKKAATVRDLLTEPPKLEGVIKEPGQSLPSGESEVAPEPRGRRAAILNRDFQKWSETIQPEPFNLIHCDFPYGVNAGDTKNWSGAGVHGTYEDKPEIYFELISTFLANQDNFIAPSAHIMFWFSMDYYHETRELFLAKGWRVDPFPFVWYKSDNTGIMPDPKRGPRRGYETALFMTRGDRKVVKPVSNIFPCGVNKEYHVSEKPKKMIEHFFRMLVDDSTLMLDPTCGSGNAVAVAEQRGARYALGLELNSEFADRAKLNLEL